MKVQIAGRDKFRFQSGFTLTELLVVISVIGVLAALVFPAYRSVLQKSNSLGCVSNLKQIHVLFEAYALDNDGGFPPVAYNGGDGWIGWHRDQLMRYLDEDEVGKSQSLKGTIFECPAAAPVAYELGYEDKDDHRFGYGMNKLLPGYSNNSASKRAVVRIKQPSQVALAMDSHHTNAQFNLAKRWEDIEAAEARHDHLNVLFVDGHIEAVKFSEIPHGGGAKSDLFWRAVSSEGVSSWR